MKDRETVVIEKFEESQRVFRNKWNRLFLFQFFPLFAVFGWLTVSGIGNRYPVLAVAVWCLGVVTMVRAYLIKRKHLRCPVCGESQGLGYFIPLRTCTGCGAKLSRGVST